VTDAPDAIPPARSSRRPALEILSLGTLCLVIAFFVYGDVDKETAHYFNTFRDTSLYYIFEGLTNLGRSDWMLLLLGIGTISFWRKNPALAQKLFTLFLMVAVAGMTADLMKYVFGRCRPEMFLLHDAFGFTFFSSHPHYHSFPSGHASVALAVAAASALAWPKFRWAILPVGIFVAWTRVVVVAHYPSDVLAGSFWGCVVAVILARPAGKLFNTLRERWTD